MSANALTAAETKALSDYMQKIEALGQREPQQLPAETWDKVWPEIQATGQVPAEYRDRIGVNQITDKATGESRPAYYDIVWESWNAERAQLDAEYHDVILKALRYALSNEKATAETQPLLELLKRIIGEGMENMTPEQLSTAITNNLLSNPYLTAHL